MTAITQPPAPGTPDELAASLVAQLFPDHTFVESTIETPIAITQIETWCRQRLEAWLRREAPKASTGYTFNDSRRVAFDWLVTTTMQHLTYLQLWPKGSAPVITRSLAATTIDTRNANEYTVVNARAPLYARGTLRKRGDDTVAVFPKTLGGWGKKDDAILDAVTDKGSETQILQRTRRMMTEAFPELAELHPAQLKIRHAEWREAAWNMLDRARPPLMDGMDMFIHDDDRFALLNASIAAIFDEIGTDDGDVIAREHVPDAVVANYQQHLLKTDLEALSDDQLREYCEGYEVAYTPTDRPAMIQGIMHACQADVIPLDRTVLVNQQQEGKSSCAVFTDVLTHGVRPLFARKNEPEVRAVLTQSMTLLAYYAGIIAIELRECQSKRPSVGNALLSDDDSVDHLLADAAAETNEKRQQRTDAQRALQAFWETLSEIRNISGLQLREVPMIVLVKFAMMSVMPMSYEEYLHLRTSL